MTTEDLFSSRKSYLLSVLQNSFGAPIHSDAFIMRIFGEEDFFKITGRSSPEVWLSTKQVAYEGFPGVANLGFSLSMKDSLDEEQASCFLDSVTRQRARPEEALRAFIADDIALLGVAEGLAKLGQSPNEKTASTRAWLVELVDRTITAPQWSYRMRALAGDLLDARGRLRVPPNLRNLDDLILESVLRAIWPNMFLQTPIIPINSQRSVLKELLTGQVPGFGDPERAAVWLRALDTLVDYSVQSYFPSISDTVRVLESVQHSFKRWVWDESSKRRNASPSHWLIDNEYHVQAFLWAVLYPIYREQLVDEAYLPNWGQRQPRCDLGIVKLKLIIEVKYARERRDFEEIEEQVAGDIGLYFKDTTQFDHLIVFVYDDCDEQYPERYDSLRNALEKRDEVEKVVIVRRPSMFPARKDRN